MYTHLLLDINLSSLIFHLFYISATASSVILVLSSKLSVRTKLFGVISWVVTLQLIVPLRLRDTIASNYPDAWYIKQLVDVVLNSHSYQFAYGTGEAFFYSFYPNFQMIIGIISLVTGADTVTIMKFLPSGLSIPFVILLFGFLRKFLNDDKAVLATQLAASCFWFINFATEPVQATFGTFFALMLLLSITRDGRPWGLIFGASLVGLALSHFLSGIYVLVVLVAAKAFIFLEKALWNRTTTLPLSFSRIALVAVAVVSWLAFEAVLVAQSVVVLFSSLYIENVRFALSAGPTTTTPIATRVIGDAGIVLYGILLGSVFIYLVTRRSTNSITNLLPLVFGGGVVFVVHLAIFGIGLSSIIDILPRGFLYVYLLGSPLVITGLNVVLRSRSGSSQEEASAVCQDETALETPKKHRLRIALAYFMIVLMLLPSMYFYYPTFRYDNSAPLNSEDVRLPLENWKYAGAWSLSHVNDVFLYGDKLAFNFVGGIGQKEVEVFPPNSSLVGWMRVTNLEGFTIILRVSSLSAPDPHFEITAEQLQMALSSNNLVYNSGESVVIVVLKQPT